MEIDAEEAIKNLSFSIVDINGYGNHIGDSDLSNEKVNVQLKLDGYEALNPGYKVEVVVNGKRIIAKDFHGDGGFYAKAVRDQKIVFPLIKEPNHLISSHISWSSDDYILKDLKEDILSPTFGKRKK